MKKYLFLYIILFLFLFYTNGFYTYFYYENEPVKEDFGLFQVEKYPNGHESVFLVTVDDISYYTDPDELREFLERMEKKRVHPTLFAIPFHTGRKITENTELVQVLQEYDVEVAQHGYRHVEKEFKLQSYEEQKRMIQKGRIILAEGFTISGFRAPGFYHTFTTSEVLSDLGYLYESEMSVIDRFYIRNLLQLPHTPGGRVYMTHSLNPSIDILENAWSPTMKTFAEWWLFRHDLKADYYTEGDNLYINLSEFREGLTIILKEDYNVHIHCDGEELEYHRKGKTITL